ncbi:hypothetical protein MBLNU459_g7545t1 [Dothideomycetes sp. NU459]
MFAGPAAAENALKRKRSPSVAATAAVAAAAAAPPHKTPKPSTATANGHTTTAAAATSTAAAANQLQINYLARQCAVDLPFITKDDTLPTILDVLSSYSHVLDRHESLASNLGARPLGPNLIKRFERCFDAPPEVIASHSHAKNPQPGDDATPTVTWLDVVHFAQAHPAQFTLSTFSEGRRVCQFYYPQKQLRVQISEEDFLFISSGRCQDLIPPLPIWEDEEKEVGTCEILEKTLRELTNAADMVAARTRQLGHRLKGRRMAILDRRAGENGGADHDHPVQANTPPSGPRSSGFVAVNAPPAQPQPQPHAPAHKNGTAGPDRAEAAAVNRNDLLKHFQSLPHNQNPSRNEPRRVSAGAQPTSPLVAASQQTTKHSTPTPAAAATAAAAAAAAAAFAPAASATTTTTAAAALAAAPHTVEQHHTSSSSVSPAPAPAPAPAHAAQSNNAAYITDPLSYYLSEGPSRNTPLAPMSIHDSANKHNFSRPLPPNQESAQPYRNICQVHMEHLPRGSRVLPPCDRCRRLRMDCVKNLSSCAGCTKKHSRCHWKDVTRDEARDLKGFDDVEESLRDGSFADTAVPGPSAQDSPTNAPYQTLGDQVTPPPEDNDTEAEGPVTVTVPSDQQQATRQAMDILHLMGNGGSATPAAASGGATTSNTPAAAAATTSNGSNRPDHIGAVASIRNNGAFRSTYTSVYPPTGVPFEHKAETPGVG